MHWKAGSRARIVARLEKPHTAVGVRDFFEAPATRRLKLTMNSNALIRLQVRSELV